MDRRFIFAGVATIAVMATGCTRPTDDPATLAAIKSEAVTLVQANRTGIHVELTKDKWPPVIASLEPQAVSVDKAGVDVLVKPDFDGGYGYLVLREGQRPPGPPKRYSGLAGGTYWYHPH